MPWILNLMKRWGVRVAQQGFVDFLLGYTYWSEALQTHTSPCVTAIPLPSHSFIHRIRRIALLCVGFVVFNPLLLRACNSGNRTKHILQSQSHSWSTSVLNVAAALSLYEDNRQKEDRQTGQNGNRFSVFILEHYEWYYYHGYNCWFSSKHEETQD